MVVKVVIAIEVAVDAFVEVDGVNEMVLEVGGRFVTHPTLSTRP